MLYGKWSGGQVNSLSLPAGSSSALNGIMLDTQCRVKSPFCAVTSSARAKVHSARLPVTHSVGFGAPRIFLILPFFWVHFHLFPLCFLPGAGAAERVRPSPNRSWVNMSLFWHLPWFLSSETTPLPLHRVLCPNLQNGAMLFVFRWLL